MQYTVKNDTPFQILTSAIVIGPSQTGYQLEVAADGKNFSPLFTVGANVTRQVTNLSSGAYYRLNGNVGDVVVNWVRTCVTEGGSGGSGATYTAGTYIDITQDVISVTGITPDNYLTSADTENFLTSADTADFLTSADTQNLVSSAQVKTQIEDYHYVNSGDVKTQVEAYNYITSAQAKTQIEAYDYATSADLASVSGILDTHITDVERVAASAITELHTGLMEVSGRSEFNPALYTPTSGFATVNGSAITNGGNITIQGGGGITSADVKTQIEAYNYMDQTDAQVIASALNDLNTNKVAGNGIANIMRIEQTAYNTLVAQSATTPTTLYVVVPDSQ